jgi:HAD domain in Swiss Army Knife RNA repair proteins
VELDASAPILLIDVDGVISLFGFDPARPPAGRFQLVDGIAHYISATAGACLLALTDAFELVWCSGWEEKANDYLPLALGLPGPLPLVAFDRLPRPPAAHWKLAGIEAYAGAARPVAWIDDAHDERCTQWARTRPAPTLLLATDAAVGLTDEHVAELCAWAKQLGRG